ncbi:2-keto-4-pentenoate hydratase [Stappia indica]|uniref:2-keto-4-pentenoate hydratase n=1 Tax=Stappia indica TaxID=538381 RepID=UPI00082B8821|nr:fumarylacetoacetate hydrolase family protein [Stappia indica]
MHAHRSALALGASLLVSTVLVAGSAQAACPDDAAIDAFLAARASAAPTPPPVAAGGSMEDALCAQGKILARLETDLGPIVGYKAGLTSPKSQEAFGVTEPVFGTLLEGMIIKGNATARPAEAVRALFEADLVVEIADAAVNDATTPEEVLAHIAGVRPFLELPALVVGKDDKLDGPAITSINVGAWKGAMGELIEIPQGAEGVAMLADFTAKLTNDANGETLSAAPGKAVLGHPLNAVSWIAGVLKAQGKALKPGDLVSVGSIGPLHPMKPGLSVTLTYEGLPGTPKIGARFE